jgi:hypothetical protein
MQEENKGIKLNKQINLSRLSSSSSSSGGNLANENSSKIF